MVRTVTALTTYYLLLTTDLDGAHSHRPAQRLLAHSPQPRDVGHRGAGDGAPLLAVAAEVEVAQAQHARRHGHHALHLLRREVEAREGLGGQ
eukprot:scaffold64845_cov30-Phaeocystis_antarctica.AAC.1